MILEKNANIRPDVQNVLIRYYITITNTLLKLTKSEERTTALKELFMISVALWIFVRTNYLFSGYMKHDRLKILDEIFFNKNKDTFIDFKEALLSIKNLIEACGELGLFLNFSFDIGEYEKFEWCYEYKHWNNITVAIYIRWSSFIFCISSIKRDINEFF